MRKGLIGLSLLLAACGTPIQGATPASTPLMSGVYMTHTWTIDVKHVMSWDGKPYIPVGTFWTNRQFAPPSITDFNLWIDESPSYTNLDKMTNDMTAAGQTYILLIAYPPPDKDARWIFDSTKVSSMLTKWKQYAPFVRKEGLRGIALFNEINWEWTWSAGYTADQYGRAMGAIAAEAREIFGGVPVFYKTAGTGGGFTNVLTAATYANGLGYDLFPQTCTTYYFPTPPRPIGLQWMAEFGKHSGAKEGSGVSPFVPFSTKAELQCHLDKHIGAGFTGFIRAVMNGTDAQKRQDLQWLGELKPYIQQKVSGVVTAPTNPCP